MSNDDFFNTGTATTLDIRGGDYQEDCTWSISGDTVVNVFGTDLTRTGLSAGTISGVLQDGTLINVDYRLDEENATLNLNPVPEPASIALGLGMLWPLVFGRFRKKR